jgi:hypothetical protein
LGSFYSLKNADQVFEPFYINFEGRNFYSSKSKTGTQYQVGLGLPFRDY